MQLFCEEAHELVIGGSVGGRSSDPDFQRIAVTAGHGACGGPWHDMHDEARGQRSTAESSNWRSRLRTITATIGLRSQPLTVGTTRRMGSTSQSVRM